MGLKPLNEVEQAQERAFLKAREEGKSYTEAMRLSRRAGRIWRDALKLATKDARDAKGGLSRDESEKV